MHVDVPMCIYTCDSSEFALVDLKHMYIMHGCMSALMCVYVELIIQAHVVVC